MNEKLEIKKLLGNRILFFDGGTGSVLQSMGLKPGELPETWNISWPEKIQELHYSYFAAGCNIIKTNTFGANSLKFPLKSHSDPTDFCLEDIIFSALQNANIARKKIQSEKIPQKEIKKLQEKNLFPTKCNPQLEPHFIALDIGPLGKLLEPLGDLSFNQAVELFSQTIKIALQVHKTQQENTLLPDIILIETMNDCYEAKAAIVAAKEVLQEANLSLPIFVTTVYDESATSLTGTNPETMAVILEGLGVDALGINCSLGPHQMAEIVSQLLENVSIPVVVNPNAGIPHSQNGKTVYDVSPQEFANATATFAKQGAAIVGGCCGTTPEHICYLVDFCYNFDCLPSKDKMLTRISSATKTVSFGDCPVLIGERINPTGKKRFKQALIEKDIPYIINEGIQQEEKGVHVLDVNVGLPEIAETEMLVQVVQELQTVTTLPLQLDTSDMQAMEAAMRIYNGKPLINSVNGKEEVMAALFPLVKKYGGVVVALTLDEEGIPETAAGRIKIAQKIYSTALKYGISKKDIIIDPLAMAISADSKSALATLETLSAIRKDFNGCTILGVSNISFGLPQRELITAIFFTMAMQNGLSAAIMNPCSYEMMKAFNCFCTLAGYDSNCQNYISFTQRYKTVSQEMQNSTTSLNQNLQPTQEANLGFLNDSLEYAIIRGLKLETEQRTKFLLQKEDGLSIINSKLIPALDAVGKAFEAKTMFLPQLLMSAEAAKVAFSVIRDEFAHSGKDTQSKGIIILATVKGDIHDIGKNIVKVLLENYSFSVIDLGKDVPPEKIVSAAKENNVQLVGLSALMTTTVPSMEATIKLLKQEIPLCKVCVGGAVLTKEYADMIGADFYAKDALETVKYAQKIFS
ncbi:MAG: homocysteine S-methyltransferase family protein [Spirochaetaceae bacterium]|nr:homocysteine S-methyltransferase family protein [Spirochaetaceae bacterium]